MGQWSYGVPYQVLDLLAVALWWMFMFCSWQRVRVRFTLRLTVGQSASQPACLGIEPTFDQILLPFWRVRVWDLCVLSLWDALSDERPGLSFVSHSLVTCLCVHGNTNNWQKRLRQQRRVRESCGKRGEVEWAQRLEQTLRQEESKLCSQWPFWAMVGLPTHKSSELRYATVSIIAV
jgi:hypothetical protein